jgi:hypothetical protein
VVSKWTVKRESKTVEGLILSFCDIFEAPEQPGLYAWYALIGLGDADLAQEEQTRTALQRQTTKYRPAPMEGEIKGNMGACWRGQLLDTSMDELSSLLQESDDELPQQDQGRTRRGKRLQSALTTLLTRQALIDTLEQAVPMFLPPLYVGMSENLNSRLQSHVAAFRAISRNRKALVEYEDESSDSEDNDEISGASFAARAVSAGFKEDNLQVFILPFQNCQNLDTSQIRDVIAGVEYLLNRWTKPSLGVR